MKHVFTQKRWKRVIKWVFFTDSIIPHTFRFRWNIVVHGGIDGYSRLIPYLGVATNNLASTALTFLFSGVRQFGIPSRLRVDGGNEFEHVKNFMNIVNGNNRNSAISGKSVHNQRIERLWRDVYAKVLDKYYKLFKHMEDSSVLEITDVVMMYCLHHVFVPRIQRDIAQWMAAHNNHKVRTERNRSPLQIWFSANLQASDQNNTAMNNIFRRQQSETEAQITEFIENANLEEPDDIAVVIPRVPQPLTGAQHAALVRNVDTLAASESNGLDIYGRVYQFVQQCINN